MSRQRPVLWLSTRQDRGSVAPRRKRRPLTSSKNSTWRSTQRLETQASEHVFRRLAHPYFRDRQLSSEGSSRRKLKSTRASFVRRRSRPSDDTRRLRLEVRHWVTSDLANEFSVISKKGLFQHNRLSCGHSQLTFTA